jgi:hypothetical protein
METLSQCSGFTMSTSSLLEQSSHMTWEQLSLNLPEPQENLMASESASTAGLVLDVPGQKLIEVLRKNYLEGYYTVSSDYARANAIYVAAAASLGYLTSVITDHDLVEEEFTSMWRLTSLGLREVECSFAWK